jgi:hypothetical protein
MNVCLKQLFPFLKVSTVVFEGFETEWSVGNFTKYFYAFIKMSLSAIGILCRTILISL